MIKLVQHQLDRHHHYHRTVRLWSLHRGCRPTLHLHLCNTLTSILIMLPVLLSVITRALVTGDNCFGGVETFERIATIDYSPGTVPLVGVLLQQENMALTRDCINLCRQQQRCNSFTLDYRGFQCTSFAESSRRHRDAMQSSKTTNLFDKVCLKGISRHEFDHICGNERLWAFERVKDSFLEGFVEKELANMADREECAKACLTETGFICRSADFDQVRRVCRLSKENKRSQPQAFVTVKESQRDYLENQCAPQGPASCIYMTRSDTSVFSMDTLQFASSAEDCQLQCDRESSFNCRAYGFLNNRCMLSSDDEKTLGKSSVLGSLKGAIFGEKTCVAELCTNGIFTYEKVTGHVLRSAITSPVELPDYSAFGVTGWCRESCDQAQLNCPAFAVNYANNRCERLDRNTQGRANDLLAKEGESYFEKICLRVPQIMTQCQDKFWAFERVLGYELAPVLYVKTLNFVQSRRDCEEYCLQEREFPCRSALYNDETTECRLSPEDRRTSPGHYYRSRSMKINYLENQCVRAHSSCPYVRTSDAYPTYTDIVETTSVVNREKCEKMCNDNRHFLCRSYAYYSSNGQCFLSGDDSASAGSGYVAKRSSIMYYERKCSRLAASMNATLAPGEDGEHSTHGDSFSTSTDGYRGTDRTTHGTTAGSGGTSTTSSTRDVNIGNANKEVIITNGTLGGIITTRITRFPENLVPTLAPATMRNMEGDNHGMGEDTRGGSGSSANYGMGTEAGSGSTDSSRFPFTMASNKKCPPNARFLFEKVTSFEPIGGHLTLLYSDLQSPGIVTECAKRCEHSSMCRAFVVDYYHQTCHGLFENSSVGALDLRLSMGKDYYEGFCVASHVHCEKYWPFDRIIDQATVGAKPEDIVRFVSRPECRARCLEERKFRCLSASYNSFTHECHLYGEDRNSGSLSLQFNKGIDFMENQCGIEVKDCRYHPIERDISIVSVTKSVRGTSTFHCEQACDYEKEFNCRSYTYLDNPDGSVAPGGNLCLLSADNRATSHQGSMQFRPRALYAEKDCAFQKMNQGRPFNRPGLSHQAPRTPAPSSMQFYESRGSSRPQVDSNDQQQQQQQMNARHMGNEDAAQTFDFSMTRVAMDAWANNRSEAHGDNLSQLQHIPPRCSDEDYTFEKTFGYDLRYARRERAPIPARPGVVSYCREECLNMAHRCQAFIVEYGENGQQNCYWLDEAAHEHRNQLNKMMTSSYSEKICLREKTCGKIWSFERIIGHMLDQPAEKEFTSIMLRTSCQDLCLAEKSFTCRALTYDYGRRLCKLFKDTRRSKHGTFRATNDHIDYFENKCVQDSSTCQYRDQVDRYLPYVDRILIASSLIDCQRQCDSESSFHCKSINFDPVSRECLLSSEDTTVFSILDPPSGGLPPSSGLKFVSMSASSNILAYHQDSIYSEKGNCEQVSVQCNQQEMLLTLNFENPFHGRVYTKINPSQCFVNGKGQQQLQFAIPLTSRCGTHQESTHNYVNEVIVQQHSVIMTDNDRTIRVLCSFEMSEQTIRLGSASETNNVPVAPNGIDVSPNANGRSYKEAKTMATLVTNTAAPPTIAMRIVDHSGHDAQVVSLGDDLTLRIELKDPKSSSFGMFARNLYARSSSGESLFLIDSSGCPVDATIFPALRVDPHDRRSLVSKFKAFRFPSTGVVNFEVQIRFCHEACEQPICSIGSRKKRDVDEDDFKEIHVTAMATTSRASEEALMSNTTNTTTTTKATAVPIKSLPLVLQPSDNVTAQLGEGNDNVKRRIFTKRERTSRMLVGFSYPSSDYVRYSNWNPNRTRQFMAPSDAPNNQDKMNETTDKTAIVDEDKDKSRRDEDAVQTSDEQMHVNREGLAPSESSVNEMTNMIVEWPEVKQGSVQSLSNAALPLPMSSITGGTSATEVPLSLAIMVDGGDGKKGEAEGSNEFDEPAMQVQTRDKPLKSPGGEEDAQDGEEGGGGGGGDHYNKYGKQSYFADTNQRDKLQTRKDLVYRSGAAGSKKNDVSKRCSQECTHTGLIIFLTTLIVTIVHLTLFTTVYVYMAKLKTMARRRDAALRRQYASSLSSSLSPSSISSSIGSLSQGDAFSFTEAGESIYAVSSQQQRQLAHPVPDCQPAMPAGSPRPATYFGMENAPQNQSQGQQEFVGSLRSKYNRENVFFGSKEQRFLGLPNYAFGGAGGRPRP